MTPTERLEALERYLAVAWGNGAIDSPTFLRATQEIEIILLEIRSAKS